MKMYKSEDFVFSNSFGHELSVASKMQPRVIDSYPFKEDHSECFDAPTHKVGSTKGWVVAAHKAVKGRVAFFYRLPYDITRTGNDLVVQRIPNVRRDDWTWVNIKMVEEL